MLKVTTHGSISSGASNGGAQAKFSDTLKLENAALTGKQGKLTLAYQFDYDAWVDASGDGYANGSVSFLAWAGCNYASFVDYLNTDTVATRCTNTVIRTPRDPLCHDWFLASTEASYITGTVLPVAGGDQG